MIAILILALAATPARGDEAAAAPVRPQVSRAGKVRVVDHSFVDDGGPFLGLGASYFTALWRCKHDRARLESDLAFLAANGFNYYRMLSMVGSNASWDGLEIAPVSFTSREGKQVDAWDDYWQQLRELIDIAYDRHGLRTQITIFADAQLMPEKEARIEHMRRLLAEIVAGREHKIMFLEVANEAWQNGFPGDEGVADLKEFARFLGERTEVPVAITSNHVDSFEELYRDSGADLATWHFSRDLEPDDGWKPVYDCWDYASLPGCPPVISNEPIGPGSSVAAEVEVGRLATAAAFAYIAKLPGYVFHCKAGVQGTSRFEETPGVDCYRRLMTILPGDLANWERHDGRDERSLFTVFADGRAKSYCTGGDGIKDGCIRLVGARKGERFVNAALGIRPKGLQVECRSAVDFQAYDPATMELVLNEQKNVGERLTLPQGLGALIIVGKSVEN